MVKKFLLFLVLNFGALALGALFTDTGVSSIWYQELPKAPWTPPGWVFGAAWTTIMIFFSFYMAYLISIAKNLKTVWGLFVLQWILNVSWNPVFFYAHQINIGLIVISLLTIVVSILMFNYRKILGLKTFFILPYFIWLLIATSLNGYIFYHI